LNRNFRVSVQILRESLEKNSEDEHLPAAAIDSRVPPSTKTNPLLTILRTRSVWVTAVAYVAVTVILSRIPLFDYLGYEFSAVIGIFGGLLSGLLTIGLFRRKFAGRQTVSKSDLTSFTFFALLLNLTLLLIPLILISLNAFFVKNCSFSTGLAFFLLIPAVTMLFSVSLGVSTAVWFRRPVIVYTIIFILILLHPIYLTVTSPQLFAYNFLFGYFPGFTYDEVLTVTKTLILSRLLTIVAALTFISATLVAAQRSSRSDRFLVKLRTLRYLFQRNVESVVSTLGLLVLVSAYIMKHNLEFESPASFIQQQLGSKYTTQHFNIYYSSSAINEDRIRWIAAEHEFRYMQVTRALRVNFFNKIDSYLYPAPELKRKLIGTSTTNIAKPWRREIHLNLDSFESTFRHELVHVVAGAFGMPFLGLSPSPGLIEGLAVAADWDAGDRTPHQVAAALFRSGLVGDVRSIFSFTGFAAKPSSVSYLLSGSFCRFLIEEYGMRRFTALYPWGQFQKVYRKSPEDLLKEWRLYLQSIDVPPTDTTRARLLFTRPSIFRKVCARAIAALNEKAAKSFNENEYDKASQLYQSSYAMSHSREAALGLFASEFRLGKYDSISSQLQEILNDSTVGPAFMPSKLTLGDCQWLLGQQQKAKRLYEELRGLDVLEAYNEAAAVRLEALRHPELDAFMRHFIAAAGDDTVRVATLRQALTENPKNPVVLYLLGKAYFRQQRYEAALGELSKIDPSRSKETKKHFDDPVLHYELEKTIGFCLLHLKDFQSAKIHLWQALNYTTNEGDMNFIDDQIEYCDWLDEHRSLLD
jgi:tetratricopeptide (TPR) repeat protein